MTIIAITVFILKKIIFKINQLKFNFILFRITYYFFLILNRFIKMSPDFSIKNDLVELGKSNLYVNPKNHAQSHIWQEPLEGLDRFPKIGNLINRAMQCISSIPQLIRDNRSISLGILVVTVGVIFLAVMKYRKSTPTNAKNTDQQKPGQQTDQQKQAEAQKNIAVKWQQRVIEGAEQATVEQQHREITRQQAELQRLKEEQQLANIKQQRRDEQQRVAEASQQVVAEQQVKAANHQQIEPLKNEKKQILSKAIQNYKTNKEALNKKIEEAMASLEDLTPSVRKLLAAIQIKKWEIDQLMKALPKPSNKDIRSLQQLEGEIEAFADIELYMEQLQLIIDLEASLLQINARKSDLDSAIRNPLYQKSKNSLIELSERLKSYENELTQLIKKYTNFNTYKKGKQVNQNTCIDITKALIEKCEASIQTFMQIVQECEREIQANAPLMPHAPQEKKFSEAIVAACNKHSLSIDKYERATESYPELKDPLSSLKQIKIAYTEILDKAIPRNEFKLIRVACELGADVNQPMGQHRTKPPLHKAVGSGNTKMVACLLDCGANANLRDSVGITPLIHAMPQPNKEFSIEIFKLLLQYKADPNLADKDGILPLERLLDIDKNEHNLEAIQCLLQNGANPNIYFSDGTTALIRARILNKPELIKTLTENPIKPDTEYVEKYLNIVFFAHALGMKGTFEIFGSDQNPHTINLEGFYGHFALERVTKYVKQFLDSRQDITLTQNLSNVLENAYTKASGQEKKQKLLTTIESGKPVFIMGGWSGHSITLVVSHDELYISNRGDGLDLHGCEGTFTIPNDLDMKILLRGLSQEYDNADDFQTMIHKLKLHKLEDEREKKSKEQKNGNCTLANLKNAIRYFVKKYLDKAKKGQGDKLYKEMSQFLRKEVTQDCLSLSAQAPEYHNFLERIKEKMETKIVKAAKNRKNTDWIKEIQGMLGKGVRAAQKISAAAE